MEGMAGLRDTGLKDLRIDSGQDDLIWPNGPFNVLIHMHGISHDLVCYCRKCNN